MMAGAVLMWQPKQGHIVRGVWLPRIQVDSRVAIFDRHPSLIYMYIHNYGDTHQRAYL